MGVQVVPNDHNLADFAIGALCSATITTLCWTQYIIPSYASAFSFDSIGCQMDRLHPNGSICDLLWILHIPVSKIVFVKR